MFKFIISCSNILLFGFLYFEFKLCVYWSGIVGMDVFDVIVDLIRFFIVVMCMNFLKLSSYFFDDALCEKLMYVVKFGSGFDLFWEVFISDYFSRVCIDMCIYLFMVCLWVDSVCVRRSSFGFASSAFGFRYRVIYLCVWDMCVDVVYIVCLWCVYFFVDVCVMCECVSVM